MKTVKQFLAISLFIIVTSCSKENDEAIAPVADSNLQIASISPVAGPKNTIVTIVGKGFSDIVANNSVTLNSTNCPIINSTNTQLTVKILPSSGSGKLKVTVNNAVAESNNFDFQVTTTISTIAGSSAGIADGQGINSKFNAPNGITIDKSGNLFVADFGNHIIRKITASGLVSTFAGGNGNGFRGFADGQGTSALFNSPYGVVINESGTLFVADGENHKIRKITSSGLVTTFAGSSAAFADGQGLNAKFETPNSIAIDRVGNLYVFDLINHKIRKISTTGNVTTVAGSTLGFADGQGTQAQFANAGALTVDSAGNIFVADSSNNKIRKITPDGSVTTIAGGSRGFDDGLGTVARFFFPSGITIDSTGNLFVIDRGNKKVRKISPSGLVTTIAGTSEGSLDGDVSVAQFNDPQGIAIDKLGNIFVTERNGNKIRKITFD